VKQIKLIEQHLREADGLADVLAVAHGPLTGTGVACRRPPRKSDRCRSGATAVLVTGRPAGWRSSCPDAAAYRSQSCATWPLLQSLEQRGLAVHRPGACRYRPAGPVGPACHRRRGGLPGAHPVRRLRHPVWRGLRPG